MTKLVTIGADPELFLVDRAGHPVPACGLIGGTKERPIRMSEGLPPQYTLQEDNVMVEFNIPPSKNMGGFTNAVQTALEIIKQKVEKLGYLLSDSPELVFSHRSLVSSQAKQFGCAPDFNAHAAGETYPRMNPEALRTKNGEWRFAGGHIHIGYTSNVPPFVAASFADVFLGLRSVGHDIQHERRKHYGQPGRYRPTAYGIEYRTLSNYWLFDYGAACNLGTSAIMLGLFLQDTPINRIRSIYQGVPWVSVQEAIQGNDPTLASSIINFLNSEYQMDV